MGIADERKIEGPRLENRGLVTRPTTTTLRSTTRGPEGNWPRE